MKALVLGAVAAVTLAAGGASAATMTFPGVDENGNLYQSPYTEDGITATGNGPIIGLVESSAITAPSLYSFTMAGAFNAVSFDFYDTPFFLFQLCEIDDLNGDRCSTYDFEAAQVTGYRGDELVALDTFDYRSEDRRYDFGASFSGIDRLEIGLAAPPSFDSAPEGFYFTCTDSPCFEYGIDNVTLNPIETPAPVPLPATAGLLMAGLAGLGLMRRRG